jgi:hypothetical protein
LSHGASQLTADDSMGRTAAEHRLLERVEEIER